MASVQQGLLSCSHTDGSRITELLSLTSHGHAGQQPAWLWIKAFPQLHSTVNRKWVSISSEGFSAVVSHAWFIHVSPKFSVLFYCNISNITYKMCCKHLFKDRKLAFQVQFCYFALLLTGNSRACRSQAYTWEWQPVLQKCSSSSNFNLLSQANGTFHYNFLNFILKDLFLLHCWDQTLDLAHSRQALHHVHPLP